mgnify:CR=1 FL=1
MKLPAGTVNEYVAPSTPMEEVLAVIWSELLGVERIGVHDRFFDLGGHSLMAMRLLERQVAQIDRAVGAVDGELVALVEDAVAF